MSDKKCQFPTVIMSYNLRNSLTPNGFLGLLFSKGEGRTELITVFSIERNDRY